MCFLVVCAGFLMFLHKLLNISIFFYLKILRLFIFSDLWNRSLHFFSYLQILIWVHKDAIEAMHWSCPIGFISQFKKLVVKGHFWPLNCSILTNFYNFNEFEITVLTQIFRHVLKKYFFQSLKLVSAPFSSFLCQNKMHSFIRNKSFYFAHESRISVLIFCMILSTNTNCQSFAWNCAMHMNIWIIKILYNIAH